MPFSLAQRRISVPTHWPMLSSLRSWVSAPAGWDLGAARAPGVSMGTRVMQSRNAEVRRPVPLSTPPGVTPLVWRTGERWGFPGGKHSTFIAVSPKTQRNVYENSCWPGQVGYAHRGHTAGGSFLNPSASPSPQLPRDWMIELSRALCCFPAQRLPCHVTSGARAF